MDSIRYIHEIHVHLYYHYYYYPSPFPSLNYQFSTLWGGYVCGRSQSLKVNVCVCSAVIEGVFNIIVPELEGSSIL